MMRDWLRWKLHHVGLEPGVKLPSGDVMRGFRSFSEYRSAQGMVPPVAEVNFISSFAGSRGIILDVGANIGSMAMILAHLRPDCIVHAFEPSPESFACLKANLLRNHADRVIPCQYAASQADGRQCFLNDSRSPTSNRLVTTEDGEPGPFVEVSVVSLDSFLKPYLDDEVAFLKIDVEGHEPSVLAGADMLLRSGRCRAGLVELCPENLHNAGYDVSDLLCAAESAGWCLRHLDDEGNPGQIVDVKNASGVVLANVALLPRS
ncbi:FkbM family methyltransferase [Prosthecobacter sp. SYSU 5D2]|uniref:FkbM family methyltransferase n=1 Tax=Prosthecobacter sp. SYSU 5D2 TaxID=3134134 RepID=UPI0031FEF43C